MTKEEVGRLIGYLRKKRNISKEKLCKGLCSISILSRVEAGTRFPDSFIVERILERLGKSVNKVEFLYDEQSYEIYYLREQIEQLLEKNEYEEVENAIGYYEKLQIAKEKLHKQYVYKIKSILQEKYYKNEQKSIECLQVAIAQTMQNSILEEIEEYCLGEEEMILLLMWIDKKNRMENFPILKYRDTILNYIRYTFTDEETLANIYAKASWIFMKEFIKRKKYTEAANIGSHTVDIIVNNGLLLNLPQLLELLLYCYEKVDKEKYVELKRERDALKWVYEKYDKIYETESVKLWKNNRQSEIYLISEVVGQERKLLKQTQEKIAGEINIDYRTISRIERGKYKPKNGTFQKLKKYLNIDRDICSTRLVVEDFELLELERDVSREMHYKRYKKAEQLYKKLKEQLSMKYNENKQYVMYMDTIFDEKNKRITKEETIEKCKEAFWITRKNCKKEELEEIVLNKYETTIINYIARMYNYLGKKEQAVYLLEQALKGFENSKVDVKYHYASVGLLYENLSGKCEENDEFDKALKYCEKGIMFELKCERGSVLGRHIMQKTYTKERKTKNKEACQYYYQQAYQLMKLMKVESNMKALENYYKSNYNKEIT